MELTNPSLQLSFVCVRLCCRILAGQEYCGRNQIMHYIIFIEHEGEENVMFAGDVGDDDADYLRETVVPKLQPLSDEAYMEGPAAILQSMAKYSYVLDDDAVFWCCEWDPGFLVLRFSPEGTMQWASFRSPNPGFGGREATEEEMAAWEEMEDEENPQYNLVFDAWDAQFDERDREYRKFQPAPAATIERFEAAIAQVNKLGEMLQALYENDEPACKAWFERCKQSVQWIGGEAS
jgi:hypothetical protein